MRSLVLAKPGRLEWAGVPEPDGSGVLVAVRKVGICGTDLHAFNGTQPGFTYPIRLGHELAVEVLEDAPGMAAGSRCAVNPYYECGHCDACVRGATNCCVSLSVLGVHCDGGMVPRLRISPSHLLPSTVLSDEILALVEPLVVGYHAVQRGAIEPGDPVLVVGLGPIGLAVALWARAAGAYVVGVDVRAVRRRAGRKAAHSVIGSGDDIVRSISRLLGGQLPRVVFDATGSRAAFRISYSLVGPAGTLVVVGLFLGTLEFEDLDFHRRELSIRASRNGTLEDFAAVLAHLESGRVDPQWLITDRMEFEQVPGLLPKLAGKPDCIKAMVTLGS